MDPCQLLHLIRAQCFVVPGVAAALGAGGVTHGTRTHRVICVPCCEGCLGPVYFGVAAVGCPAVTIPYAQQRPHRLVRV